MKQLASLLLLFIAAFWIPANAQNTIQDTIMNDTTKVKQEKVTDAEAVRLPWHARRFRLSAGAFFPINNTNVRVGNNSGSIGTDIDFEDDLGFESNTNTFYANAMWRASRRSRFELEYFVLNRSSVKVLERQIEFEDNVYDIGVRVEAYFDSQIIRFSYGYAFISKPKYEIGFLVGTHIMLIDVGLKANTNNIGAEISDDFGVTAPLPDLGLWSEIVLTKKMGLYANINYLSAKVDTVDGSIVSYNLSLLYNVYKNFSLTAGYSGLNVKVDVEKPRANGYFKWGYNGPSITATYTLGGFMNFNKRK
jgi:hypothetical protein